jgi:hypothetical protein
MARFAEAATAGGLKPLRNHTQTALRDTQTVSTTPN